MIRVGIIADDLTGAADTAVQFVRAGWNTELQLGAGTCAAQAIALTTESRGLTASASADAVLAAVRRLRDAKVTHLYKKIDSTLRGQIRAEVQAAVTNWSPRALALVCPAFPAMGRTVVSGQLKVNGVPVNETAAASDPVTPVTESHLPTLVGATLLACHKGESSRELAHRISGSGPLVVADAVTESDLRQLAEALALLGPDAIPVGSAGLARHIATVWAAERPAPPAVVIVTSLQDAAQRQADAVVAAGGLRVEPTLTDLLDDAAWTHFAARAIEEFDRAEFAFLLIAPVDRSRNLSADLIPRRFAELTARILAEKSVSGVVVTGGDGARALLHALNATGIALRDEVVTGVPIGTLTGGRASGLPVVTKAGGFGDPDALLQAVHTVRFRRYS